MLNDPEKIINLQHQLVELQLGLTRALRNSLGSPKEIPVNSTPKLEVFPYPADTPNVGVGYKITTKEILPRVAIYSKVNFKERILDRTAYKQARNHWYSIIRKAVAGKKIKRITPAFIVITYYVSSACDVDNFTEKFIIDGLMYAKVIGEDDNCYEVPGLLRTIEVDPGHSRTEVYVLPDIGQIKQLIPKVEPIEQPELELENSKNNSEKVVS